MRRERGGRSGRRGGCVRRRVRRAIWRCGSAIRGGGGAAAARQQQRLGICATAVRAAAAAAASAIRRRQRLQWWRRLRRPRWRRNWRRAERVPASSKLCSLAASERCAESPQAKRRSRPASAELDEVLDNSRRAQHAVHRRLHPRLRPLHPPTVVFHELEEPEPEPELTWDASRGTGGDVSSSSSAATARMRGFSLERLSDNVLHDTRRAHARASRAGWDVGERPAARMAYIEYPADARVAPVEAATRHALAYTSAEHRTEPKYAERARRLRQTRVLGWGSSPTAAYAPLGPPEDESRLGPNRFVLKAREAITVVEPALAAVSLFADELKPTELTPGVAVRAHVRRHQYWHAIVQVFDGLVLRVHLEALTGDPDLYVCNRDARPTHESHTWRATGVGDDRIEIDPDEPNARPGAYYIGVFGLHASEFVLHSACVPKAVRLPKAPTDFFPKGYEWRYNASSKGRRGAAHAAARRGQRARHATRRRCSRAVTTRPRALARRRPVQATIREATSERGMAHLHAADALEARLRELRRPPPDAAAAAPTAAATTEAPPPPATPGSPTSPEPRRSDPHRRAAAPRATTRRRPRRPTAAAAARQPRMPRSRRGRRAARAHKAERGAAAAAGQVEATARRRLGRPAQGHADPARGRRVRRGEARARGAPPRAARRARRPSPPRVRGATLRAVRHRSDVGALRGAHRPTRRDVD